LITRSPLRRRPCVTTSCKRQHCRLLSLTCRAAVRWGLLACIERLRTRAHQNCNCNSSTLRLPNSALGSVPVLVLGCQLCLMGPPTSRSECRLGQEGGINLQRSALTRSVQVVEGIRCSCNNANHHANTIDSKPTSPGRRSRSLSLTLTLGLKFPMVWEVSRRRPHS
jgi:hypothetical protein